MTKEEAELWLNIHYIVKKEDYYCKCSCGEEFHWRIGDKPAWAGEHFVVVIDERPVDVAKRVLYGELLKMKGEGMTESEVNVMYELGCMDEYIKEVVKG